VKWVHEPFFAHLFKSSTYIQALRATANLIRDGQDMRFTHFAQVPLPKIPLDEQVAIADHLDLETARIDKLIARKTRFIELLAEKRQALNTQAVTKGLNPKRRMKDSSLEWLGKVPEHWSVVPFRIAAWYQEGPGIMAADFIEEGIPLLRVSCVQSQFASLEGCNYLDPEKVEKKWKHFRVDAGDLLISASATTGSISEVSNETVGAIPYTGIIRLKPSRLIDKEYLKSFLASQPFREQINLFKVGSTIQHYGPTHLSQMKIILPPIPEQKEISKFIRVSTERIDALIAKTELSIALLREHRTALISAAVTGKIDLRGNA
jgi:type I restriction enzyme S subunit